MANSKTLPQIKKINALIALNVGLLLALLVLINYSDIDLLTQNCLFDFENKAWLIDRNEPVKKFIFYQLPKIFFGVAVAVCLIAAILGFKGNNGELFRQNRHRFFLIFLGLTLIPLIAGNIKKITNVYCPCQLEIYGGSKPYVRIFESYPKNFYAEKRGKCFPAGHAVTGFSLFILFFAFRKKSHRILGLASGVMFGGIASFYQMAKGVHFLGDSLVSMLVCFLLAALIYKIYFQFTNSTNDQSENY